MDTSKDTLSRLIAWKHVVEAYQTCHQKYARMMSHFDLTPSQFDVLMSIDSLGGKATPKEIAKGLLVTKGNITSVTRRLLERNLICQKAHDLDKRSIVLALTGTGKTLLKNAKSAAKDFVNLQLAPFSQNEVDLVGGLMQQMRAHLDSNEFDAAVERIIAQHSNQHSNNQTGEQTNLPSKEILQ